MSIRLNRKKLLCISFFLCCVLPACFSWFSVDEMHWSGLSLVELPLLISSSLFALALLFEHARYTLPVGIISHLLLMGFFFYRFANFPLIAGISTVRDWSMSADAANLSYWISLALVVFHLTLFASTEIAVQKLYGATQHGHSD